MKNLLFQVKIYKKRIDDKIAYFIISSSNI